MIDTFLIRRIARGRLKDAKALLSARRCDGAAYLCGYAVELALKARICRTLKWLGFPSTTSEFKEYQTLKTHNLDVLLHLTGREQDVKTRLLAEWSVVAAWNPEARYQPMGKTSRSDAEQMIAAAETLLRHL